jgi:hypothetical protein
MEFRLIYQGRLKANGGHQEKQEIRRFFHPQLKALWQQKPLSDYRNQLPGGGYDDTSPFIRRLSGFTLIPLVIEAAELVAELDITLLRPEPPGSVITQGGDIDNRLKTLLDALRNPKNEGELPKGDGPRPEENPFFCLLEDDNLITHLSVKTDRLLLPVTHQLDVVAILHVQTKVTRATMDYMGLGI